ncbi:uncharacterized protein LOC143027807 [Oratosquilla oratoria]|uniref:uncharacterized protein LOC143027807 n=1 Tax=Oratosquilla oratoria TaxID=337810 RepID=UPI003F772AF6
MSATPPPRRRNPRVTVRRVQSERRYLSPWEVHAAPTPSLTIHSHILFQQQQQHLASRVALSSSSSFREEHHHATRTALIPPPPGAGPLMIGYSQFVLTSPEPPWAPPLPRGPPLGCFPSQVQMQPFHDPGSHPPQLQEPVSLEEDLMNDRLAAFVYSPAHRPRSILSCPESPLYESLVSCMSDFEEELIFPESEAEHEYQQIPGFDMIDRRERWGEAQKTSGSRPDQGGTKIQTLDIRPDKKLEGRSALSDYNLEMEDTEDIYEIPDLLRSDKQPLQQQEEQQEQQQQPKNDGGVTEKRKPSVGGSQQSLGSIVNISSNVSAIQVSNNHQSIVTINTTSPINNLDTDEGDTEVFRAMSPIVVTVKPLPVVKSPASDTPSPGMSSSKVKGDDDASTTKDDQTCSPLPFSGEIRISSRNRSISMTNSVTSSTTNPVNSEAAKSSRQGSGDFNRVHIQIHSRHPDSDFVPFTIELPEAKEDPKKSEQQHKATQVSLKPKQPITTLDPGRVSKTKSNTPSPTRSSVPPLVVNFDSENSEEDEDLSINNSNDYHGDVELETSPCTTDGSFLFTDDSVSMYSTVSEIYSIMTTDPDSFVYVYKPPPRRKAPIFATLDYRLPLSKLRARLARRGSNSESSGRGSSGSDGQYSTWGSGSSQVSFVEPSYRPPNISVGSMGHMQIDYSWSWDRLDPFMQPGGRAPPRGPSAGGAMYPQPAFTFWDRYTHPVGA